MDYVALPEQFEPYRHCFPGPHSALMYTSIIAGNTAGRLWVLPQAPGPPLLLLWDKGNNVFYLAGDAQEPTSLSRLSDVVATHLRPHALAEGKHRFKVCALSPSLERGLPAIFANLALHEYPALFYAYVGATLPLEIAPPTLPDLTIVPLTRDLLARHNLAHREDVLAEIRWMWPSEDRFFTDGFGTLAIVDAQIICWCTAEYVSPRHCGIGITTAPPYERRGVATATATSFVREALRRGLTPCWECGRANHGSARVAEKVGFVRQAEEIYWIGSFER